MELSDKTIEEIADQLDCGMKCYLKKSTCELISVMPSEYINNSVGIDSYEDIHEIYENPTDYIEFVEMSSRESFDAMMDFAQEIPNESIKASLISALNSKSPFKNFKMKIDDSGRCRQNWFAYKRNKYIEYVRMQIPDNMIG